MIPFKDRPPRRPFSGVGLRCPLCGKELRTWRGPGPHFCSRCRRGQWPRVKALVAEARAKASAGGS